MASCQFADCTHAHTHTRREQAAFTEDDDDDYDDCNFFRFYYKNKFLATHVHAD